MTDKSQVKTCVLAYSGGLDTSIIIPWLKENYDLEVHCVAGDVGQGEGVFGEVFEQVAQGGVGQARFVGPRRVAEDAVEPTGVGRLDGGVRPASCDGRAQS